MKTIIPGTLADALPYEFMDGSYDDTPAFKLHDVKVIEEVHMSNIEGLKSWRNWPGIHRNVANWYILENGKAVGWNESPSRGWSFPVIKYKA